MISAPMDTTTTEMHEDEEIPLAERTLDMIGDGSQPYALPTLSNIKYDRFKRIDAATLVSLIEGRFNDTVESFTIVDCRYPYEYEGGHIVNSLNIHTGPDLIKLFLDKKQSHSTSAPGSSSQSDQTHVPKRHIIIFHCEFSSERGPRLMKLLREKDRQINRYPELLYPELYLLAGGYKEFYNLFKGYCTPQSYKPMKAQSHREELRCYRKRRKMPAPRRKENKTPDISFEG